MKANVWALVAIIFMVLTSVTVLLAMRVPVTDVFVAVGLVVSPVLTFLLYQKQDAVEAKVDTVVKQTNGMTTQQQQVTDRLLTHIGVPPAPDPLSTKE